MRWTAKDRRLCDCMTMKVWGIGDKNKKVFGHEGTIYPREKIELVWSGTSNRISSVRTIRIFPHFYFLPREKAPESVQCNTNKKKLAFLETIRDVSPLTVDTMFFFLFRPFGISSTISSERLTELRVKSFYDSMDEISNISIFSAKRLVSLQSLYWLIY